MSGNLLSSVLGFISFAILAKSLGPELLAYFALAQMYAYVVNDLLNVQTWESLIKFGTRRDAGISLGKTIKTNVLIDLVSAFLAFVVAKTSAGYIGQILGWDDSLIRLAAMYSFVIPFTITTLTIGIPRLFDKFAVIAQIQFAMAGLKLIFVIVVSYWGGSPEELIIAYIAAEVLLNGSLIIYSLVLLRRKKVVKWRSTSIQLSRDQVKFLWWANLRTIVRIPIRQADVLIINQLLSMDSVGIYKAYKEVVGIIARLGEPVNQAIYPEYGKLLGKKDSTESVLVTKKIMKVLFSVGLISLIAILCVSKPAIEIIFGVEYLKHILAFYFMTILYCIGLFLTPINSLFVAAGFVKHSFYIVLLNNIVYLIIAILGGIAFGIYGIVFAFGIQMLANKGLKIYYMAKNPTDWGDLIR